jgi:enamine deaminase RidA (YjgF/YER057c/UK114 family)
LDAAKIRSISPHGWPRPRGYANGILVPAGRDLLFVAGMIGWDDTEKIVRGGMPAQFEQALRNVLAVVRAADGRTEDIVRMLVFVTSKAEYIEHRTDMGDAWRRVMGKHYPTMALVEVAGLVETGAVIEVEAIAAIGPAGDRRPPITSSVSPA